jgi:uncharacterized protein (TIGR03435 family)
LFSSLIRIIAMLASMIPATQSSTNAPVHVGDSAPEIRLETLLQAPPNASVNWKDQKGKVVVIEFGATWCAPCIDAIPHMNQLAGEFKDQPITFLTIMEDDSDRLERFLKTAHVSSWIGVDTNRRNWDTFDIHALPTTIIVDSNGTILAVTRPDYVNPKVLRDALEHKSFSLPSAETRDSDLEWDQEEIDWKDGVEPSTDIIIKPISTATGGMWLRPEGDHLTADGVTLEGLIFLAYGVNSYHVDWRMPSSDQKFRVAGRVPKGHENELLPLFQAALAATFPIHVQWRTEEKDVYVLRIASGANRQIPRATIDEKPLYQMIRGEETAKRQPLQKLVVFLENTIQLPVVDETGLTGEYDWDLPYQHGQPDITLKPLRDALGLELVKERRSIKMLVVQLKNVER